MFHIKGWIIQLKKWIYSEKWGCRDDGFGIFKGLNENTGFLKVFFTIILVQAAIVNAALIPIPVFAWIGEMFSCVVSHAPIIKI